MQFVPLLREQKSDHYSRDQHKMGDDTEKGDE